MRLNVEQINMEEFRKAEQEAYVKGAVGLNELVGVAVAFIVIAIVAGFGVLMLSEMKEKVNVSANPDAGAVLDSGVGAVKTITDYLSLIALAIVIGIILTIVIVYLYRRFGE